MKNEFTIKTARTLVKQSLKQINLKMLRIKLGLEFSLKFLFHSLKEKKLIMTQAVA